MENSDFNREHHRIFAAIVPPNEVRQMLYRVSGFLAERMSNVRIRRTLPKDLHLTLKFIGDADDAQVAAFRNLLSEAAEKISRFKLHVRGLGIFRHRRGTTLWAGVSEMSGKENLVSLSELVREIGVSAESRFVPHITLGRSKAIFRSIPTDIEFAETEFCVGEIVLFESLLRNTGAEYKVISRHPLTG